MGSKESEIASLALGYVRKVTILSLVERKQDTHRPTLILTIIIPAFHHIPMDVRNHKMGVDRQFGLRGGN